MQYVSGVEATEMLFSDLSSMERAEGMEAGREELRSELERLKWELTAV